MAQRARHLELTDPIHDPRYDCGKYPSIAMNNHGVIVEVVQNSLLGTSLLSYRVGKSGNRKDTQGGSRRRRQNEIDWISRRPDNAERIHYEKGKYPRVAINNLGTVIVVHQKDGQCFYCVGKIAGDNTIDWFYKEQLQAGGIIMATPKHLVERSTPTSSRDGGVAEVSESIPKEISLPSVALKSDRDEAIATFVSKDRAYYCQGTLLPEHGDEPHRMTWTSPRTVPDLLGAVTEVSVAVNSEGTIAFTYRRQYRFQLYFAFGSIDGNNILQWAYRGETPFGYGFSPVVSLNSNGYFVIGSQSWIGRKTNFWIGNVHNVPKNAPFPASDENKGRGFGFGCYPSIACNDAGDVVEVHETNFEIPRLQNSLFYRSGKLKTSLTKATNKPAVTVVTADTKM